MRQSHPFETNCTNILQFVKAKYLIHGSYGAEAYYNGSHSTVFIT